MIKHGLRQLSKQETHKKRIKAWFGLKAKDQELDQNLGFGLEA
jgi:hypothetical protein